MFAHIKKLAKEHDEVELDIVNSGNKNIASRMAAADKTAGEGTDTNSIQNRY
jgi:hypothetical protein